MDAHLRAGVQMQAGEGFLQHLRHAQILHDHCVCPSLGHLVYLSFQRRHLAIAHEGIDGHIELHAVQVTIIHGPGKAVPIKIGSVRARAEKTPAQIDGVCAVLHGGNQRIPIPDRGQ